MRDQPASSLGNDRSHGSSVPDRRRLDRDRRRHRPPGRRGRLPARARRALGRTSSRRWRDELGGIAVACDVTEYPDIEALVERARAEYGRIDVVFANAGVGHPRGFEAGDAEAAKQMVLINVFGIYATIRATAAALRATKGHLVITCSIAGRRALEGHASTAPPSSPSPAWPRPPARTSTAPACARR